MRLAPEALDHVRAIPPYPPGRPISAVAREFGFDPRTVVKLASNENPLGVSAKVLQALRAAAEEANIYPDFDCHDLVRSLASDLSLDADHVLAGSGSSELIGLAARAFLAPGLKAVIPQYGFVAYEGAVRSVGAQPVEVPVRPDWSMDLEAMLAAIDARTRIVFLASPTNPLGLALPRADIEDFFRRAPDHVLVVLDEAYREYMALEDQPDLGALMASRANSLVLRTFSKIHGLAGLRVGYGVSNPEVLGLLRRLQPPFSVNAMAQAAAVAALGDREFRQRSYESNRVERARLCAAFDRHGFDYLPSQGNFVMAKVGDGPAVYQALMRRGVIVRPVANYGLKAWIRVSIGLAEQNDAFLRHLRELMPEGSATPPGAVPA